MWIVRKIKDQSINELSNDLFIVSRDMAGITCEPRKSKKGGKYDYDYYGGYGY